ncbi:unnamed protein product [marine sediment metagenome]|uniref:RNA-binding S4 domain-containing protein n=1 Tax=marine sediment metagenome TaxID=412755 RepID=X0RLF3_9ZZZZ
MAERLQKVLAAAGVGSRRACEELILEGRVRVNRKRVDQLPVLVDPSTDDIRVDGRRIHAERKVYYLLNKPKGVLCTQRDPAGRTRATDLLTGVRERVYPVGRLDAGSQGLVLLTNDGELAAALTHPRYGVPKTYRARIRGKLPPDGLKKLRQGIWLSEGRTQPARVTVAYGSRSHTILEITLREGRNRQVRRMLVKLGHPVRDLTRVRMGRLSLRGLGTGRFRALQPTEVKQLQALARGSSGETSAGRSRSGKTKRVAPVKKRKRTTARRSQARPH